MGNGALPHGPSYRAHPRLYLGFFHCGAQNFDAIGGTTDIDRPPAPIASEAYDPQRTAALPKSCTAQVLTWSALSSMLRAFRVAAT
jgi:hypothetical protein